MYKTNKYKPETQTFFVQIVEREKNRAKCKTFS